MNIKQKISVVLAASMLLPTAVSAAQFNVDDGAIIKPLRVSEDGTNPKENGKENPPEPPKDNTGNEGGKKEDDPSENPDGGKKEDGPSENPDGGKETSPEEGDSTGTQPENSKEGETGKDPEVKEDSNIFLIMKAVKESDEDYYLKNSDSEEGSHEEIIFNKNSTRIKGINWDKVKKVTLSQDNNTKNKDLITDYMIKMSVLDNNLQLLAKNNIILDKLLEDQKNKLIKESQDLIDKEGTSEEDKQVEQEKINKIKLINKDNLSTAEEPIKEAILSDIQLKQLFDSVEQIKENTKLPKLNLILELTTLDGKTEKVTARTIVTNDGFTDSSVENQDINNIVNYIDNLQNELKKKKFDLNTQIEEYNQAKEKYKDEKAKLEKDLKNKKEDYNKLWDEVDKLLKEIYNNNEPLDPTDNLDSSRVKRAVTKFNELKSELDQAKASIKNLESQKSALENSQKELQAEIQKLKDQLDGSTTTELSEAQVQILKDTITGLVDSINSLNLRYDASGIPHDDIYRFIQGMEKIEDGVIKPNDKGPKVDIPKLIKIEEDNNGQKKVVVDTNVLIEYLLKNGNTEEGKNNIKEMKIH